MDCEREFECLRVCVCRISTLAVVRARGAGDHGGWGSGLEAALVGLLS